MAGVYTHPMTQQIRDFSLPMDPVRFRIDPDTFDAPPILSPMALKKAAALHSELGAMDNVGSDIDRTLTLVAEMFAIFVPGRSGQLFKARLLTEGRDADPDNGRPDPDPPPIDLTRQALPVLYWLLEQYGLRPTGPSSPSLNGSTDGPTDILNGGTSSTAGALPATSATSN